MKTIPRLRMFGTFLSLLLLSSCATENHLQFPARVTMNQDAGRGNWLIVMIRLKNGEELPFMVDTGCPFTMFDKSLEPRLGKRLATGTFWNMGLAHEIAAYAAPELYLRNTLLLSDTNIVLTDNCKQFSCIEGHPTMGILGMDVLKHYCIQLDFQSGRVRFLHDERANKKDWGKAFSLIDVGDGCFFAGENLVGAQGPGSLIDTGNNGDGWLTPELFQRWTNQATPPTNGEVHSPNGVLGGEVYHDISLDLLYNGLNDKDLHSKFNGIGLYVLSRNLVTFDFPKQTMYLKRTSERPLFGKKMQEAVMSALDFLSGLREKDQLPGWSKNEDGTTTAYNLQHSHDIDTVTLHAQKKGDSSFYHYTVIHALEDSHWKLQKAWRTDKNAKLTEEYPVP